MPDAHARPHTPANPVGRGRVVAELLDGLDQATRGHGQMFLLAGEPGIGKTTLARTLSDHAHAAAAAVVWGACSEVGGVPAFWPWMQVLRGVLELPAGRAGVERLGDASRRLGQLLPELAEERAAPAAENVAPAADEGDRFALFDAAARLLRSAAEPAPLVVILDDLHAADDASLRLLQVVARTLHLARLLVVGTFRDEEVRLDRTRRAPVFGDLVQQARVLPLRGLDLSETGAVVQAVTGTVDQTLARSMHELTGGNPLFLHELLRLLHAEGRLIAPSAPPVPESVRETIRRRLDLLAGHAGLTRDDVRAVLGAAAVIGREFRVPFVERVCGRQPATPREVLDAATAAGLFRRVDHDRFAFAHALVRETLYADLPAAERARLHAAVADAVEAASAGDSDEHVAELAHHLSRAAPIVHSARIADCARAAGDRARRRLAYEEAARWYRLALDQADSTALRCDLLLAAGEAGIRAGTTEQARAELDQAVDLAVRVDDRRRHATAVMHLGELAEWGRVDHRYVQLATHALAGLDDDTLRVKLLGRLATALRFDERPHRRGTLSAEAVALARELGDPALLSYALDARLYATWGPDTLPERLTAADEILALAEQAGDLPRAFTGHMWRLIGHLEHGDMAETSAAVEALAVLAERLREPRHMLVATSRRAMRAFFHGDYAEGERLAHEAHTAAGADPEAFGVLSEQLHQPLADQGRTAEIEQLLERMDETESDREPTWRLRRTLPLLLAVGRVEEARIRYEQTPEDELLAMLRRHEPHQIAAAARLAHVAAVTGSLHGAAALYELLAPYEHRNAVSGGAVTAYGCVARYLGLLARALGEIDRAAAHFDVALHRNRAWSARPWVVHTAIDYAALLVERDTPGDVDRARTLLAEARRTADEIGMSHVVEVVKRDFAPGTVAIVAGAAPPGGGDALRREGDVWAVSRAGHVFRVKGSKGMGYLAHLLAQPDADVHVLDLVGAPLADASAAPLLDRQAKTAYRNRLRDLADDLAVADAHHDTERAAGLRREIQFLEQELLAATGLGGRDRTAVTSAERARVAVTKAIRTAIRNIGEHDRVLGRHLELTVQTGRFCRYTPAPGPTVWSPTVRT
jgi:tetratricopeptide (TPR) repeat protein